MSQEPVPSSSGRTGARSARLYWMVLGLLWGLPAVIGLVAWLALPDENASGQCEGIGFGCTPTPKDSVLLLAIVVVPVMGLLGAVAVGLIAVRRWWHDRRTAARRS